MMRIIAKTILMMVLLGSSVSVFSQVEGCSEYEEKYEKNKDNPIIGSEVREELRACYLDKIEKAIRENQCDVAQEYYKKYKDLYGKTDINLEQRIYDCQHPLKGTLVINGNKTLLKQSDVRIDGNQVNDPTQPQSLNVGDHTLLVKHPNYDLFKEGFRIEKDKPTPIEVKFDKPYGHLKIRSNESWLKTLTFAIYRKADLVSNPTFDNLKNGVQLECDTYKVSISKGFQKCDKYVTITNNTTSYLEVKTTDFPVKEKYGKLRFEDNTEEKDFLSACSIYVNKNWWSDPQNTQELKCGEYSASITHDGYTTSNYLTIKIEENVTCRISLLRSDDGTIEVKDVNADRIIATMIPKKCEGSLKIDAGKDNAILQKASIYFDGREISGFSVGKEYTLSCGKHSIRIEHEDYEFWKDDVTIEKDSTIVLEPILKPVWGYLKIEGDSKVLSESKIKVGKSEIDSKTIDKPIRMHQDLCVVEIMNDKYEPFIKAVPVYAGKTDTLIVKLIPKYVKVNLKVEEKDVDIYIKDYKGIYGDIKLENVKKYRKSTFWEGETKRGKNIIICRKNGWKESRDAYTIDESTGGIKLVSPTPYLHFVTLDYDFAYGIREGAHLLGASFGRLVAVENKLGVFLSGMARFSSLSVVGECDEMGYLADGSRPEYVDIRIVPNWSAMVGVYWRFENFYLKGGFGLGKNDVDWQIKGGSYYRNLRFTKRELALTYGVQYHVDRVALSLDVVTIGSSSNRTWEVKGGIGWTFW